MRSLVTSVTLWIGIAMLGSGFEIWFTDHFSLPLAVVWIVGPLLWYGGFMVVCSVFLKRFLQILSAPSAPREESQPAHANSHVAKASSLAVVLMFSALVPSVAQAADAAATFKGKCAMCHGASGDGKTAMGAKLNIPDLKSKTVQDETDAQLASSISKGKNKMPAFTGKLSDAETKAMVAFIRQIK